MRPQGRTAAQPLRRCNKGYFKWKGKTCESANTQTLANGAPRTTTMGYAGLPRRYKTCKNCPTGKYQENWGQERCLGCDACKEGKERRGCGFNTRGSCDCCSLGTYKIAGLDGHHTDQCLSCPKGKHSNKCELTDTSSPWDAVTNRFKNWEWQTARKANSGPQGQTRRDVRCMRPGYRTKCGEKAVCAAVSARARASAVPHPVRTNAKAGPVRQDLQRRWPGSSHGQVRQVPAGRYGEGDDLGNGTRTCP